MEALRRLQANMEGVKITGRRNAVGFHPEDELELFLKEIEADLVLSTSEDILTGGEDGLIRAEEVQTLAGEHWIKLSFNYSKTIVARMKRLGEQIGKENMFFNKKTKMWGIKAQFRPQVQKALSSFLIKWEGEDPIDGGIDTSTVPVTPIYPDYTFKTPPLKDYQIQGWNVLVTKNRILLADDPGLGKTWQVINAVGYRRQVGQVKSALIITKASLTYNFRDEVDLHSDMKAIVVDGDAKRRSKAYAKFQADSEHEYTFLVMSYETFRNDANILMDMENYRQFDLMAMDEAHKVKNHESGVGAMIHHFLPKYRILMTATPVINSPTELFNLLTWLGYMDMDWWNFRNRFCVFGGYANKDVVGYKNLDELYAILDQHMLRRTKRLLGLPEISFRTVKVPMTTYQSKIYSGILDGVLEELKDTEIESIPNPMAKATRLQQVANATALIQSEEFYEAKDKRMSGKLNALDDMLDDIIKNQGKKVILFSRFKEMVDIMEKRYAKYNPAIVTGSVSSNGRTEEHAMRQLRKEGVDVDSLSNDQLIEAIKQKTASPRMQEVYKFRKDESCKLFIGVSSACREGLNLVEAHHVIFVDVEFAWAYIDQAFSRGHRNGLKHPIQVTFLASDGTVDEKILLDIEEKKDMTEVMMSSRAKSRQFLEDITGFKKAG